MGLYVIVGLGIVGAVFAFVLGFVPASHLTVKATGAYAAVMVFGVLAVCITPFILHRKAPAAPLLPDGADQPPPLPSPAG